MAVDGKLKSQLQEIDEVYGGDNMAKIFGMSALSHVTTDSSRMYMFTAFLKQTLTLLNPDVPRLQTGFENSVGKYNTSYKKIDGSWEVKDVIRKFNDAPTNVYTVILYNKKNDIYDMIENVYAENLTERFGFLYDNSRLDNLKPGDYLKDEIITKSTAYDEHMNYRYGKNANVYYSTSTDTLEDSISVRQGWAESVKSVEIDTVQVSINNNDVPLNLYGTEEEYKTFPNIGETVISSTLCATRRINKNHFFYDFQTDNMRQVKDTDTDYFVTKDSIVYDINVYYNGDNEFPDNVFYKQLKHYYDCNNQYAAKIVTWCNMIKESGSKYTLNITHLRSIYKDYNSKDYKWKIKNSVFGNILVEFKVKSIVGIEYGSKLSGRFGDKGVVGSIVDDAHIKAGYSIVDALDAELSLSHEEKLKLAGKIQVIPDARMPYTDDGPVDIILNMSGSVRRLNPGQLGETEVNFQGEQVRKLICQAETIEEKQRILFKFLDIVNEDQSTFFKGFLEEDKKVVNIGGREVHLIRPNHIKQFIESVEKHGFYIVRPPHKPLLYKDIVRVYEEFPSIKPVPLYIDLFGIKKRRIIKDGVVGSRYILILKQNTNKKFSARSTFRVNRSNLPTKDSSKKNNRSAYARTPVRLSEINNLFASISGLDIAEYNVVTRSSALGRKSLESILAATGNPLAIKKIPIKHNYSNLNAENLSVRLKSIGIGIDFRHSDDSIYGDMDENVILSYKIHGHDITDTLGNKPMYEEILNEYYQLYKSISFTETYVGEKSKYIWELVWNNKDQLRCNDKFTQDVYATLSQTTADRLERFEEMIKPKVIPQETITIDENGETVIKKKRGRKPKGWVPPQEVTNQK